MLEAGTSSLKLRCHDGGHIALACGHYAARRGGPARGTRAETPTLEAPAGHTLIQYAGLKVTLAAGQGDVGVEEEDVLVLLAKAVRSGGGAVDAAGDPPVESSHIH